ncbi:glycosyltransferase family 2 protein [Alloprevotella sp. OH1205_COT-284]|uniref:glycosyltransferase family A protein n=1 Tax=Alloprevotella sp. OH1205_COT-284 TaxID=2491043 RepID=UPI000F5FA5AC|nr:glycosyltransferase family A protein [Alloprevotella sp. OH1205_COT-284]RRD79316.1 glycosyltransferase family 2 protein [Alloprevotella sp. OH1205_COT-284]
MSPRLSVLVCTINDRIKNVPDLLLPPRADLLYVVSFQYTASVFLDMIPPSLKERDDVKLVPFLSSGLSANRNNAFRHCTTELALIADDDVRYSNDRIDMVLRHFAQHPDIDIMCFQAQEMDGTPLKAYPSFSFEYSNRPKGSYFTSFEIAFRTDAHLPAFDTRFGLGASYLSCGEEEVFLHQAHRWGARIVYFPEVLCLISGRETTGKRFFSDTKVRRSKGAVFYMMFGFLGAFLRITKHALLLPSSCDRWKFWKDMLDGIIYIFRNPLNEGMADEIPLDFQTMDFRNLP